MTPASVVSGYHELTRPGRTRVTEWSGITFGRHSAVREVFLRAGMHTNGHKCSMTAVGRKR